MNVFLIECDNEMTIFSGDCCRVVPFKIACWPVVDIAVILLASC